MFTEGKDRVSKQKRLHEKVDIEFKVLLQDFILTLFQLKFFICYFIFILHHIKDDILSLKVPREECRVLCIWRILF